MVGIYGPVYFLIVGFIGQFANITLRLERGVSLVFLFISLFLMYKIAALVTKNKIIAVIVALLPLTHPVVRQWGYMGRSDSLALMFALSGIYIVIKYGDSRKLYLSVIPFALAFFTKQYYLAGAIAVPSVLIINKQVKAAFAYALVYLFAIGIGLGLGTMLVGASFFKELVTYNQTMPLFQQE